MSKNRILIPDFAQDGFEFITRMRTGQINSGLQGVTGMNKNIMSDLTQKGLQGFTSFKETGSSGNSGNSSNGNSSGSDNKK